MMLQGQREIEITGILRRLIQTIRTINSEFLRAPEHRSDGVIKTALAEQNIAIKEAIDLGVIRR